MPVTSTLAFWSEQYPQTTMPTSNEAEKQSEQLQQQSNSVQNGVEPIDGAGDEAMAEGDIGDEMTTAME